LEGDANRRAAVDKKGAVLVVPGDRVVVADDRHMVLYRSEVTG
jgi:hypothetical protein